MSNTNRQTVGFMIFAILLSAVWYSCKKDDPVQPTQTSGVCSRLSLGNNKPAISMDCNGYMSSIVTNIQYDQYGRIASYDFDFHCASSTERYTGSISNIQRNSSGQITAYQATVNGESCT